VTLRYLYYDDTGNLNGYSGRTVARLAVLSFRCAISRNVMHRPDQSIIKGSLSARTGLGEAGTQ